MQQCQFFCLHLYLCPLRRHNSPTDEEFIAKLNGARYILSVNQGSNVISTRDIQENQVIEGSIYVNEKGSSQNKSIGVWKEHGIAGTVHGREYSSKVICDWDRNVGPNEVPKKIVGLLTCKISEDSITCVNGVMIQYISIFAKGEKFTHNSWHYHR